VGYVSTTPVYTAQSLITKSALDVSSTTKVSYRDVNSLLPWAAFLLLLLWGSACTHVRGWEGFQTLAQPATRRRLGRAIALLFCRVLKRRGHASRTFAGTQTRCRARSPGCLSSRTSPSTRAARQASPCIAAQNKLPGPRQAEARQHYNDTVARGRQRDVAAHEGEEGMAARHGRRALDAESLRHC